MNFELTDEQQSIQAAIQKICQQFDDAYWLARDTDGTFPEDFVKAITEGGWLGIAMPEAYGGAGLGVTETAIMAHAIARSGAGMSGASAVHLNLFGPNPIVVFGTEEQKARLLPPLIKGQDRACFGVTEPDAGLNTTRLATRAVRDGDHYRINGRKLWTTTAQTANKILIIARTQDLADCKKPTDGLTLFFTDLNRDSIEVRLIDKMGRKAIDSNALFIDDLIVPVADRIGEEGDGWKCLLHGLNPERILIAAEAVVWVKQRSKKPRNTRKSGLFLTARLAKTKGFNTLWLRIGWNLKPHNLWCSKPPVFTMRGNPAAQKPTRQNI